MKSVIRYQLSLKLIIILIFKYVIEFIDRIGVIFNNGASKLKLLSTSNESMATADNLIISLFEICKIFFSDKRSLLIELA